MSPIVTNGSRSVGMLSLIGIMGQGRLCPAGTARRYPCAAAAMSDSAQADRLADGGDPPRLCLVAGEAERPALGEARLARAAAGDHRRGVAVLNVAPPGEVD